MSSLSNYYSAVQAILSGVTCNTYKDFSSLQTDEDRIKYVLGLACVRKAFTINYQNSTKSAAQSRLLRDKGNASYQAQNYREAIEQYNQSICVAPWEVTSRDKVGDSEELALAFGNRSATLYQMKQYATCLLDIDLAIMHRYPEHLMHKLIVRKSRCHLALGNVTEAIAYLKEVEVVLPLSRMKEKQRAATLESVGSLMDVCRSKLDHDVSVDSEPADELQLTQPTIHGYRNVRFTSATRSFDIQYDKDRGRYVRSSADLPAGSFFVVETPYASVLSQRFYSIRCYHCFDRFEVPIPCSHCTMVRYCSEYCRVTSWDCYHERECPFLSQLVSSGTGNMSHLALRLVLVTGLRRLLSGCKSNSEAVFTDSHGKYQQGYPALYNLVTNVEKRQTNNLFQYAILAAYLVEIVQKMNFFTTSPSGDDDTPDGSNDMSKQVVVGGVLLRFLQIISCNGIDVMQTNIGTSVEKSELVSIGLALFTTISLLNHSCNPNADLIFYKNTCAVRTIQWVNAKDEMHIDYGYLYYSTSRGERRSSLREQYFFDCMCMACSFNWDLKTAMKSGIPPLKCSRCGAPLLLENRAGNGEDPTAVKCFGCKTMRNPLRYFEQLQESSASAEQAYRDIKQWNINHATPVLEKHIMVIDRYVQQPWREYVTCVSALKSCYRLLGNTDRSVPPGNAATP